MNSPLPPLPTAAAALFAAWLEERGDLARIAARLNRPPHEILAALRSAPLADYITAAEFVADRALRRRGLDRLAHVMENSPDLAEQRRAATALQQALNRDQRTRSEPAARHAAMQSGDAAVPRHRAAPRPAVRSAPASPGHSAPDRVNAEASAAPHRPAPTPVPDDRAPDDYDHIDDLRDRLTERLAEHLDEDEAEDIAEDLAEDFVLDDQTDYARHILNAIQSDPNAYPSYAVTAARALLEPPDDPPPRPP